MGVLACMLVILPTVYLTSAALLVRLLPGGLGIGYYIRHYILPHILPYAHPSLNLGVVNNIYDNKIQQLITYNATKYIIIHNTSPYLDEAIYSFFMGAGLDNQSPYLKLINFIQRISTYTFLPYYTSYILIKKIIVLYSIIVFISNICGINYWLLKSFFDTVGALNQVLT